MSIEHIAPKSVPGPDGTHAHAFAWDNLAVVCSGGPGEDPHCDKAKGSTPLSLIHPVTRPVARHARLGSNGRLRVMTSEAEDDIARVLNLDARSLVRRRLATLKGLQDALPGERWRARDILSVHDGLPAEFDFRPFVTEWLERQAANR